VPGKLDGNIDREILPARGTRNQCEQRGNAAEKVMEFNGEKRMLEGGFNPVCKNLLD